MIHFAFVDATCSLEELTCAYTVKMSRFDSLPNLHMVIPLLTLIKTAVTKKHITV